MNTTLDTDHDLRRYLLGDLPEPARDALELELLAGDDAYPALLTAEDDLIDDYARGRLSDAERRSFEERLLPLPGMTDRVAFARRLDVAVARDRRDAREVRETPEDSSRRSVVAGADRTAWSERLAGWLGGLLGGGPQAAFPALRLAGAAVALLLLATAGWLAYENAQLDRRVAELEAHRQALAAEQADLQSTLQRREAELSRELAAARSAAADRTASGDELAAARERIDTLEGELSELRRKPAPRKVAVSFLLALATRSAGVRDLAVPEAADSVELQLDTAGDGAVFDAFRAQVLGPGGTEVWSRTGLVADPATGTVDVEIPAPLLPPGRYEVLLEGVGTGGPELVGAYEFELRRR